jgi:hypothetical protein
VDRGYFNASKDFHVRIGGHLRYIRQMRHGVMIGDGNGVNPFFFRLADDLTDAFAAV